MRISTRRRSAALHLPPHRRRQIPRLRINLAREHRHAAHGALVIQKARLLHRQQVIETADLKYSETETRKLLESADSRHIEVVEE